MYNGGFTFAGEIIEKMNLVRSVILLSFVLLSNIK